MLPQAGLADLTGLVGDLIERLHGDRSLRVKVKGNEWPNDLAERLADLIRVHRWAYGCMYCDLRLDSWREPDRSMDELFTVFENEPTFPLMNRENALKQKELFYKYRPYFDRYYEFLRNSVMALADAGILVNQLKITADEKVDRELHKCMEFSAVVALSRRYANAMQYLATGRGICPVSFESKKDEDCEGLVIVDAIAHWYGMTKIPPHVHREDVTKYQRWLDRMSTQWKGST